MKTRDELAEALLIASVEESKIMPAATAFNLADAFVAERERRAYPLVNDAPEAEKPHSPDDGCAKCEHRGEPYGYMGQQTCGKKFGLAISMNNLTRGAPAECPKRVSATPAAEALGFVDQGGNRYLTQRGQVLDAWAEDRFGAGIYPVGGGECVVEVKLRATDQAHAERIVAAMLPVGRGTK